MGVRDGGWFYYFMKSHSILSTYCSSTFVHSPLISLLRPPPTPTVLSAVLFVWLNKWSHHIWCAVFLPDNMDLHMSSLGTLVPERPWCVFYAIRHLNITGTLIWYHSQTHTAHSGTSTLTSTLTDPYKYKFTPPVMCSCQLPLLH